MKGEKYIFFIDIDDTLIPAGSNEISADIISEIERLKKLGHIFVISTGRALKTTTGIKGIEAFQYLSVLLGSCIYEMPSEKLLYKSDNMPEDETKKLTDYLDNSCVAWSYKTPTDEKTYYSESPFFKSKKDCKFVTHDKYNKDLQNKEVMQLLAVTCLSQKVMNDYPICNFFLMPNNYTDISLNGCTKGRSVRYFKTLYPDYRCVAIGDSLNDLATFEEADVSIAMGNASNYLKEKVDFVTKRVDDGGLIYAFTHVLKI